MTVAPLRNGCRLNDALFVPPAQTSPPKYIVTMPAGTHVSSCDPADAGMPGFKPRSRIVICSRPSFTVLYAATVRPFDAQTVRATLGRADVVLVEPYLAGTSTRLVADALVDVPHRTLGLGVRAEEIRRYGEPREHRRAHGLDAAGLRVSIDAFLVPGRR